MTAHPIEEDAGHACSVADCERKQYARDYCKRHYNRWREHGDPGPAEIRGFHDGCQVPGCDKPHEARGWCGMHYNRWRVTGSTEPTRPYVRGDDRQRILSNIQIDDAAGCWLWTGSLNTSGYGHTRFEGHSRSAHRAAYMIFIGKIPEGLTLDHLCRVRRCVNPEHLEPVTHQVNILRGETRAAAQAARTMCPRGHEYAMADSAGRRRCRTCRREQARKAGAKYRAKKKDGSA